MNADAETLAALQRGVITTSAAETQAWAQRLAGCLPATCTLAFHGDMGVGKTTFIQGLAAGLGVAGRVTSPTFNLFSMHEGSTTRLLHLDAYRLENSAQVDGLMLEDFLVPPYCLAVEWPSRIADWLPPETWHLHLGITPEEAHSIRLEKP